jgi:A/G-specific adenine glycosylase
MLQQTRVETVIPYYQRFVAAYPDVAALASSPDEEVLKLWEGLGYYSRAHNLLEAVREVHSAYGGVVPRDPAVFRSLRGVGEYTVAAVCSIAYRQPLAVVDGNVRRVLCRLLLIESDLSRAAARKQISNAARDLLDPTRPGDFNQAVMELGALICIPRSPRCSNCPLTACCRAYVLGKTKVLPVRPVKKQVPVVYLIAAVVVRDRKFLVRRRTRQGLLKGLWEFPSLELAKREDTFSAARQGELLGGDVTVTRGPVKLRHVFSHLRWEVSVYFCEAHDTLSLPLGETWRWVSMEEMKLLPFPVVYHSVIQSLTEQVK